MNRRLALAVFWTLMVVVLHAIPRKALEQMPAASLSQTTGPDKLVHAAIFALWSALWWVCVPRRPLVIFLVGLAFGAALEVFQSVFVPGRTGSVPDFLFDAIGLAVGLLVVAVYRGKVARRGQTGPA